MSLRYEDPGIVRKKRSPVREGKESQNKLPRQFRVKAISSREKKYAAEKGLLVPQNVLRADRKDATDANRGDAAFLKSAEEAMGPGKEAEGRHTSLPGIRPDRGKKKTIHPVKNKKKDIRSRLSAWNPGWGTLYISEKGRAHKGGVKASSSGRKSFYLFAR